jgi:Uncharacterized low-complexity proteins
VTDARRSRPAEKNGELPFGDDLPIDEELARDDYHAGKKFEGISFADRNLDGHTFEDCVFASCHFSEMSLARVAFVSCTFKQSELSLVKLENTTLNTVRFEACKLIGLNFTGCNKFGFLPDFDGCLIDSSVFCSNSLKKGRFIDCTIRDCDFMECDMREADFARSSLDSSTFQKCNLEKADFRSSVNYSIDPLNNRISKARFTLPEAQSFLGFLGIKIE